MEKDDMHGLMGQMEAMSKRFQMTRKTKYEFYKNYIWTQGFPVGYGAHAFVYKGKDIVTGASVAVKVFHLQENDDLLQQYTREVNLQKAINHRNIIKTLDPGNLEGDYDGQYAIDERFATEDFKKTESKCLFLEYCNGSDLHSLLNRPENAYGLPESEFLLVLEHLTNALIELHKNQQLAHRDIKPANILLNIEKNSQHVYKIADFGHSKKYSDGGGLKSTVGMIAWMHPAVIRNHASNDRHEQNEPEIDIWSLACSVYFAATGQPPFVAIPSQKQNSPYVQELTKNLYNEVYKKKPRDAISFFFDENTMSAPMFKGKLPNTCLLSAELKERLERMFKMVFNNIEAVTFEQFFAESKAITSLKLVHVINYKTNDIFGIALGPEQTMRHVKESIERYTGIKTYSQFIIANNMKLGPVVNYDEAIKNYPIKMDEENPLLVVDLSEKIENLKEIAKFVEDVERPHRRNVAKGDVDSLQADLNCMLQMLHSLQRRMAKNLKVVETLKESAPMLKAHLEKSIEETRKQLLNYEKEVEFMTASYKDVDRIYKCMVEKPPLDLNIEDRADIRNYEGTMRLVTKKFNDLDILYFDLCKRDQELSKYESRVWKIILEAEHIPKSPTAIRDHADFELKFKETIEFYNTTFCDYLNQFHVKYQEWYNGLTNIKNACKISPALMEAGRIVRGLKRSVDDMNAQQLKCISDYLKERVINELNKKDAKKQAGSKRASSSIKQQQATAFNQLIADISTHHE